MRTSFIGRFGQVAARTIASGAGRVLRATPAQERHAPAGGQQPATGRAGFLSTDGLRQLTTLALSIAQVAVSSIIFSTPEGRQLFDSAAGQEPILLPAGYTFSIWGFIYPAAIVYGIYQALPGQRTNPLLRRIGWPTAFAFGCITLWSIATIFDPLRLTPPLFFGALAALLYAMYQTSRAHLTTAERWCVLVPLSVYAAWSTVGSIANTTTSLYGLGYTQLGLGEPAWATIMLLIAGALTSFTVLANRGNRPYAAGIIWALVGIAVANLTVRPHPPIAALALGIALVVAGASWRGTANGRQTMDR